MDDRTVDEPPLGGRGVMLIDEFSRAIGLGRPTVDALVTDRKVEGLRHLDGRVFAIFGDVLPTKVERIVALGSEPPADQRRPVADRLSRSGRGSAPTR